MQAHDNPKKPLEPEKKIAVNDDDTDVKNVPSKKINIDELLEEYHAFIMQYHEYYKEIENATNLKTQGRLKKEVLKFLEKSEQIQYRALKLLNDHKIYNRISYLKEKGALSAVKLIDLDLKETKEEVQFFANRIVNADTDRIMLPLNPEAGKTINRKHVYKAAKGRVVNRKINPIRGGKKTGNIFSKKTPTTVARNMRYIHYYPSIDHGAAIRSVLDESWQKINHILDRNLRTNDHWNIEGAVGHDKVVADPETYRATTIEKIDADLKKQVGKKQIAQQNEVLLGLTALSITSTVAMTREIKEDKDSNKIDELKPIEMADKLNALYLNYAIREVAFKRYPDLLPLWQHLPTEILCSTQADTYLYTVTDQIADFEKVKNFKQTAISYQRLKKIQTEFDHTLFEPSIRMYFAIQENNTSVMYDEKLIRAVQEEYPDFAHSYYKDAKQKEIWNKEILLPKIKNEEELSEKEKNIMICNVSFFNIWLKKNNTEQKLVDLMNNLKNNKEKNILFFTLIYIERFDLAKKVSKEIKKTKEIDFSITVEYFGIKWNIFEMALLTKQKPDWGIINILVNHEKSTISKKLIDVLIKENRIENIKLIIDKMSCKIEKECIPDLLFYLFNNNETERCHEWLSVLDTDAQAVAFQALMQKKKFILAYDLLKKYPNIARQKYPDGSTPHHLIACATLKDDKTYLETKSEISEIKIISLDEKQNQPIKKLDFFKLGLRGMPSFEQKGNMSDIVDRLIQADDHETIDYLIEQHIEKFTEDQLGKLLYYYAKKFEYKKSVFILNEFPALADKADPKLYSLLANNTNCTDDYVELLNRLKPEARALIFREKMNFELFYSAKVLLVKFTEISQFEYQDKMTPHRLIAEANIKDGKDINKESFFMWDLETVDLCKKNMKGKTLLSILIEKKETALLSLIIKIHIKKIPLADLYVLACYFLENSEFEHVIYLFQTKPALRKNISFRTLVLDKLNDKNEVDIDIIFSFFSKEKQTRLEDSYVQSLIQKDNFKKIVKILYVNFDCDILIIENFVDYFISKKEFSLAKNLLEAISVDKLNDRTKKTVIHTLLEEEKPTLNSLSLIQACLNKNPNLEVKDSKGISIMQALMQNAIQNEDKDRLTFLLGKDQSIAALDAPVYDSLVSSALKNKKLDIVQMLLAKRLVADSALATEIVWTFYENAILNNDFIQPLIQGPGIDYFNHFSGEVTIFEHMVEKDEKEKIAYLVDHLNEYKLSSDHIHQLTTALIDKDQWSLVQKMFQQNVVTPEAIIKYQCQSSLNISTKMKFLAQSFDEKNTNEKDARRACIVISLQSFIKEAKTLPEILCILDKLEPAEEKTSPWNFLRNKFSLIDINPYGNISSDWVALIRMAQKKMIEFAKNEEVDEENLEVIRLLSLYPLKSIFSRELSLVQQYKNIFYEKINIPEAPIFVENSSSPTSTDTLYFLD